jgi:divalent metal cation (Fe/Co/Zn/Cd) transporter
MKYLKVIVGLVLIPLGVFVGGFISLGGGSAAILGGIVGVILCCMLFWSSWPHWSRSANLDELYMDNSDKQKQATDEMVRSMREVQINDALRIREQGPHF